MRCLFVPNFHVHRIPRDNPAISPPNKIVDRGRYWFFKHLPEWEVDVLDIPERGSALMNNKRLRLEVLQGIKTVLTGDEYDFILAHSYNSAFVLSAARVITRKQTPPLFVVDIGCLNGHRDVPLEIAIIRRALKSVDGIIYHSRINEQFYAKHFPRLKRKFVLLGTDIDFFRPAPRESPLDYALSIGAVYRDYRMLLDAWKTIDLPMRIVGPSTLDMRVPHNVEVMPRVSIVRLREMIRDARIVVLPVVEKRYSVGQTTLIQCMAMGKPIAVTHVPGIEDYISPNHNCLAVRPGDTNGFAEAVRRILTDVHLSDALAANAANDAARQFDEKQMALEIREFVEGTIKD